MREELLICALFRKAKKYRDLQKGLGKPEEAKIYRDLQRGIGKPTVAQKILGLQRAIGKPKKWYRVFHRAIG